MNCCEWCLFHGIVDTNVVYCPICEVWYCSACLNYHLKVNNCNADQLLIAINEWITRTENDGETNS